MTATRPAAEPKAPRPGSASARISRAARVKRARKQARERINALVTHPIDTPGLIRDPLEHVGSPLKSTLLCVRLIAVALLLHGLIVGIFAAANSVFGGDAGHRAPERVQVHIVVSEPRPPPASVTKPAVEQEEPEEAVPVVAEPVVPKPRPRKKNRRKAPVRDPVQPASPEPPNTTAPRRRVVGLDLSSTVVGGSGPAFATGTTRMGRTAGRAVDPEKAARAPAVEHNQAATRLPVGNTAVIRPRRLRAPAPEYPPLLRQQGIEADVVLVVTINAGGQVRGVRVIRPAPETAFNDAAVRAARQSEWTPATRAGEPFETTQRYTVRFRLND